MKKPSVPRRWLLLIAGGMWTAAGIILIERAYGWLTDIEIIRLIITLVLAIVLGLVFYYGGFMKIAIKNINRINSLPENVCLFAFTAWKGYLVIIIMVIGGILLRNSSVPKHYLTLIYLAMGITLLMGSSNFFVKFFVNHTTRK